MRMSLLCRKAILAASLSMATVGCGTSARSLPTIDARGIVTFEGDAVRNATVVFSPTKPGGRAATARTNGSGRFILSTLRPNDGALEGDYKVMIHKLTTTGGMTAKEYEENYEALTSGEREMPEEVTENALPEMYGDPETTLLTATVEPDKTNYFRFNLSVDQN